MKKSYSSGDVAKICDVTPRTIIRWIASGKLEAFQLPGRGNNRVSEDALLRFLQANEMPVPAALNSIQERHCVIVAHDKHFVRHVKRIIRNADYLIHVTSDPIEAGLNIASKQPSLVVLDEHALPKNAEATASKIKQAVTANANIILFSDNHGNEHAHDTDIRISRMQKPLNVSQFADHIDLLHLA